MTRVGRHARGRSAPAGRRARLPWVLWGVGVLAVAGGLVAMDRVWLAREQVDAGDPAVRVAGAVRSISGSDSVRSATYDPAAKAAKVEVTSKYYDAAKPANENREYLSTEGRLGAQLALFGNTPVQQVTILLYVRRTLLATVTARQGQKYEEMKVEYSGPVVRQ
ncbi:MAG: hypothetical protein ACT4P5_14350 [Armatimonadota bacterium]